MDLRTFKCIIIIQFSCLSMSKILSLPIQMESLARCLGGCVFPVPEEVVCSFFNILFDIFWAKYKFGLCIKTWRRGCGCVQLSFYLSKGASLCSRQGCFCYTIAYFVPFEVIPKLSSSIVIKIVTIHVVLVDRFYFYMHQPIKPWLFEKIIF